ncbi:MAG TPA: SAM-dependent methyltransferase, partial [Trebonia sp.]|nr:SAM-dependent methyltransferase [Trebonia sp.]
LAIAHPAIDIAPEQVAEMVRRLNETTAQKTTLRDRASVARLFEGYDLEEPGVVRAPEWRPRSEAQAASPAALWAGVARKRA